MADARAAQVTRVDSLFFSEDYATGKVNVNGNVFAQQAVMGDLHHPAASWSVTRIAKAFETPAEDNYRRFDAITQQQTQDWQRTVAQEQERPQSQGMHRSL